MLKNCFLLFISLCFINAANAQKIELSLTGGAGTNGMPKNSDSALPSGNSGDINYVASVKLFANTTNWQFGLGIDMQKISRKDGTTKYIFGNPSSPIYLFANRKLSPAFYAGAKLGIMFANSANYAQYPANNKTVPEIIYYEPGTGFMAGLHLGYVYELGKRFDLNAELGGNYTRYGYSYVHTDKFGNQKLGDDHYHYLYYSIQVGIRLKLFTDPFNQW